MQRSIREFLTPTVLWPDLRPRPNHGFAAGVSVLGQATTAGLKETGYRSAGLREIGFRSAVATAAASSAPEPEPLAVIG